MARGSATRQRVPVGARAPTAAPKSAATTRSAAHSTRLQSCRPIPTARCTLAAVEYHPLNDMDYFRAKRYLDALPDWEVGRAAVGPLALVRAAVLRAERLTLKFFAKAASPRSPTVQSVTF